MPFGKTRTAATYAKVILRLFTGQEVAENSVVDGTLVPLNGDGRRVLEAGTVMTWVGAVGSSKVKPAAASGIVAADVAGIVMHTTEFWPETTEANKDDASVALYTKNCSFDSTKLLGYSGNAAAVKSAMSAAGNQRCANCTFEP
jgi:hypothetical protein